MASRALALSLLLLLAAPAAAQDTCCRNPRTIKAEGVAYAEVAQELTAVRVTVGAQGQSASSVQGTIAANLKSVLDYLGTQGGAVSNVQSTGTQLYPEYNYDSQNGYIRYFRQYSASATASFELAGSSGGVLDGLQALGVATIESINKKESYDVLVAAQRTAVRNALTSSRQNAENMLQAIGEKLGKVLYLESSVNDYLQQGGGSIQVVRGSATVTYEIVG
jgi:uncharacterized protein YggE